MEIIEKFAYTYNGVEYPAVLIEARLLDDDEEHRYILSTHEFQDVIEYLESVGAYEDIQYVDEEIFGFIPNELITESDDKTLETYIMETWPQE